MNRIAIIALLIARIASAAGSPTTHHLWAPVYPTWAITTAWANTNDLRCVEWIPEIGITNASSLAFYVTAGLGAGALCGAALYDGTGATRIATTGAQNCASSGVVGANGLTNFSLTEGTKYLVCTCASTSGGSYMTTDVDSPFTADSALTQVANAITPTIGLDAATACSSGAPPTSTGALSAVQTPGLYLLIATTTP